MASSQYDLIVIGAGPGGYVAAIRAAQLGMSVAVVERDSALGGTCGLRGCIPTKALLHTADLLEQARNGSTVGVLCAEVRLDLAKAQQHKEKVVKKSAKGVEFLFRKNKITWLQGHGRLLGGGRVEVAAADGQKTTVGAKNILLATGSRCSDLPHIKADGDRIINSDHALELKSIPASLVVVGAGAVGMEFASMFSRFGAKVTVVEMLERVLPLEDPDVSKEVERQFRRQGIEVHTSTPIQAVELTDAGVRCTARGKDGAEVSFKAERLLLGVGRAAVTEGLGLESTKARVERGRVVVDADLRTEEPGVYAIGDLINTPWLAHV